jgi:signal transduction histidine kinase
LIVNFCTLYKYRKKDKSVQLRIIYWLNTLLIIIAIIRLYATFSLGSSIDYYYNESKQLLACRVIFFSGLLLLYVFISNYYYQHTLDDQKLLLNKLEERDLKLNISISEKNDLSNLIAEREKMLSLLSSSNKLISSSAISASIAHEINQPLAAIKLNAELLKLNILNKGDRLSLTKPIDSIIEDNERINQTIKSLRNLFLDKSEKSSEVNIDKLIKLLISTPSKNFSKTKIKFDLNLKSEGFVLIDSAEFNQAFINILRNAIDELQSVEQTNKLIKISTYDANDSFHLNIEDNGRGIPVSLKGKIFELFKSGKKEGMGLGLWLTKYIVLRHKGKISFRSRSGAGTEFMIEFPLVKL